MSTSEQIRRDVGHPIIDADGHVLEVLEATYPHLREALGATRFEEWRARGPIARLAQRPRTTDDRLRTRTPQGAWWGTQTVNVRDRATATLPALLAERSEEIGIDYFVLYPPTRSSPVPRRTPSCVRACARDSTRSSRTSTGRTRRR